MGIFVVYKTKTEFCFGPIMTAYVAYYRVSIDRQGASGLGLDAQRQAVRNHIGSQQLAAEYTEIEGAAVPRRPGRVPQTPRRAGHRQA